MQVGEDVKILFDSTKSQELESAGREDYVENAVSYNTYTAVNLANYDGTHIADLPQAVRRIRVFVSPSFYWQYDQRSSSSVRRSPEGDGTVAPIGWRFPARKQMGLVLFQPSGKTVDIPWTKPSPQIPIDLADQANGNGVYFAINFQDDPARYAKFASYVTIFIA